MIFETAVVDDASAEIALGPWSFCAQPPDAISHPEQLRECNFQSAVVPGTVASSLQALGQWDFAQPLNADAHDWWYRTSFDAAAERPCSLCFDGLATLAEVWLNGRKILSTDNMFRAYRVDVANDLRAAHEVSGATRPNELVIAFRSFTKFLGLQRARPRWKTNLVHQQQLRWVRTTLLGRIPGWTPPIAPVGPWRAVRLETAALSDVQVVSTLDGDVGRVMLRATTSVAIRRAIFRVGAFETPVEMGDGQISATVRIPKAPLWWPHTHGAQPLLAWSLEIDGQRIRHGNVGFRTVEVDRAAGFGVKVNCVPVFCRGACWTVADIVTLDGSSKKLAHDLRLARDAGVNMLRVGGTMIYEADRFYERCDQLGILVWQDFMFANMDYPVDDPAFAANIETEAIQQLQRLAQHPSVAIFCGNSEVEQQAAMLGMPREIWRNRWFAERLPMLHAEHAAGTAYVPSTPSGGTMPFHVKTGLAHFYGVGAYFRPVSDVRRAEVNFTPECLAFANVPEAETTRRLTPVGTPEWKQRVPRDGGAGWDFEDVRDHYLKQLFSVDPVALRSFDLERYLSLSRVVSGEMMAQVFAEWRSVHSYNRGALVWFFKDLWPGAGCGIIDSLGIPKAAYYYLKRAWQSVHIGITDEGLDGLHLHVSNETADPFRGFVELMLLKDNHVVVARREVECEIAPRHQGMFESDAILDGFYDVAYAYRFGPPKHDVAITTLFDAEHRVIGEAFHFVQPREPMFLGAVSLLAEAEAHGDGSYEVRLKADLLLRSVSFDARGFLPSDNYFHLVPGREKKVRLRPLGESGVKLKAYVEALNLRDPARVSLRKV